MSAYRHMEFVTQIVESVVKAHLPKPEVKVKAVEDIFATTKMVISRLTSESLPLCRECQRSVEGIEIERNPNVHELTIGVWCHGEVRRRPLKAVALMAAKGRGMSEVVELIQHVACSPWFWPLPPPGPEVP